MDFFQLRYFLAVAREGSFARAAGRVHASQPSLSIQIKKLEDDLHCKLFQRTARGVHLTSAGERVLASVERVFGEVKELRHDLGEKDLSPFQLVRIGIQPLLASVYLPSLLRDFLSENPQVQIQIIERSNAFLPELLLKGDVHLCLMARSDLLPKSVEARHLLTSGYSVFSHSSAVLSKHKRWTLQKLLSEKLLLYRDPMNVEDRLQQLAKRHGVPLNVLFTSDHAITTLGFCAEGLGLAILPSFIAEKTKGLNLKSRPIHDETLVYNAVACLKQDSLVSEPAKKLVEFLKR